MSEPFTAQPQTSEAGQVRAVYSSASDLRGGPSPSSVQHCLRLAIELRTSARINFFLKYKSAKCCDTILTMNYAPTRTVINCKVL